MIKKGQSRYFVLKSQVQEQPDETHVEVSTDVAEVSNADGKCVYSQIEIQIKYLLHSESCLAPVILPFSNLFSLYCYEKKVARML